MSYYWLRLLLMSLQPSHCQRSPSKSPTFIFNTNLLILFFILLGTDNFHVRRWRLLGGMDGNHIKSFFVGKISIKICTVSFSQVSRDAPSCMEIVHGNNVAKKR